MTSALQFEQTTECRGCRSSELTDFFDVGEVPLADAFVRGTDAGIEEPKYPLTVAFCSDCSLVQIRETVPATTLFGQDYPYYSSFSPHLVEHSRQNVEAIIDERNLGSEHLAVELASNDGYLLQWFQKAGVRVLGIDPAPGPADAAIERGIPTLLEFFDDEVAQRLRSEGTVADVIIGNNILAHVPDQNRFVRGIAQLLADDGIVVHEFPYVRDLVDHVEFDTIYHEHACYFSVHSVRSLFSRHGLTLSKVEHLPIHGGSLRVYFTRGGAVDSSVDSFIQQERDIGLTSFGYYEAFAAEVLAIGVALAELLDELKGNGARIAAYGAAAKGTMLLNNIGIDGRYLEYVVDRNIHKHGWNMPGVGIPICDPAKLLSDRPDYTLILAWNFKDEIIAQQKQYLDAGGRFIVPIPASDDRRMTLRDEMIDVVGLPAIVEADDAICWACESSGLVAFYAADGIPVQSCVLLDDRDSAATYPTGDLLLGFCEKCGFIENVRFNASLIDYSLPTEESQTFSATFREFSRELAQHLHEVYRLADADVLEIGCGKGDFLFALAELGLRSGTGIDPGFLPNRSAQGGTALTFIRDWYDDRYGELTASLVITRHLYEHVDDVRALTALLAAALEQTPGSALFNELPDARRVLAERAFWDVYYEHCSYFTMGSFGRLLRSFDLVQKQMSYGFGGQYLLAESVLGDSKEPHGSEEGVAELAQMVVSFAVDVRARVRTWRDLIDNAHASGERVALWGGGSKAISFFTAVIEDRDVAVVDINPHKQGKWLAGTHAQVQSPDALARDGIDHVIIMNAIYRQEIVAQLAAMGLDPMVSVL